MKKDTNSLDAWCQQGFPVAVSWMSRTIPSEPQHHNWRSAEILQNEPVGVFVQRAGLEIGQTVQPNLTICIPCCVCVSESLDDVGNLESVAAPKLAKFKSKRLGPGIEVASDGNFWDKYRDDSVTFCLN